MRQHISDKKLEKFFADNRIPGSVHYFTRFDRRIRYIRIGKDERPATLFFIPGSPASVDLFKDYYTDPKLLSLFTMYCVDRPGFGRSGYGKPEPSIQKQSEMTRPVIDELNDIKRPLIICASSYGASIACRMIMDHPALADGLVLEGPSLAPGQEKMLWVTPLVEHSFLRWLIPPHHRSSNTEKIHHKKELEKMLPLWKNIRVPIIYIQGEKDKMIYKTNAAFAKEKLINASLLEFHFRPGREHFISRKERPFITRQIIRMYGLLTARSTSALHR